MPNRRTCGYPRIPLFGCARQVFARSPWAIVGSAVRTRSRVGDREVVRTWGPTSVQPCDALLLCLLVVLLCRRSSLGCRACCWSRRCTRRRGCCACCGLFLGLLHL